ncbi:MAG: hypothetical protein MK132_26105 [Lentisphaerales bacterium]|nr:hypothetical protein [Lentisphaerales bacterium]
METVDESGIICANISNTSIGKTEYHLELPMYDLDISNVEIVDTRPLIRLKDLTTMS